MVEIDRQPLSRYRNKGRQLVAVCARPPAGVVQIGMRKRVVADDKGERVGGEAPERRVEVAEVADGNLFNAEMRFLAIGLVLDPVGIALLARDESELFGGMFFVHRVQHGEVIGHRRADLLPRRVETIGELWRKCYMRHWAFPQTKLHDLSPAPLLPKAGAGPTTLLYTDTSESDFVKFPRFHRNGRTRRQFHWLWLTANRPCHGLRVIRMPPQGRSVSSRGGSC